MSVINNHILQAAGGLGCTKASQHQQKAHLYVRRDGTTHHWTGFKRNRRDISLEDWRNKINFPDKVNADGEGGGRKRGGREGYLKEMNQPH